MRTRYSIIFCLGRWKAYGIWSKKETCSFEAKPCDDPVATMDDFAA